MFPVGINWGNDSFWVRHLEITNNGNFSNGKEPFQNGNGPSTFIWSQPDSVDQIFKFFARKSWFSCQNFLNCLIASIRANAVRARGSDGHQNVLSLIGNSHMLENRWDQKARCLQNNTSEQTKQKQQTKNNTTNNKPNNPNRHLGNYVKRYAFRKSPSRSVLLRDVIANPTHRCLQGRWLKGDLGRNSKITPKVPKSSLLFFDRCCHGMIQCDPLCPSLWRALGSYQ